MGRMTKIIGFSVPPALVDEVDQLAKEERRTKSELFREMLRVYLRYRKRRDLDDERWVADLIQEAKEEQEINPMTPQELVEELKELGREIVTQADKLGINPKDIDKIIYESRKKWASS